MRRLPLLLTMLVGVALWATPSHAQVVSFFKRYVANSAAPGQNNNPLPNGYEMCPPNSQDCAHESQAHFHVDPLSTAPYATNVLDTHNCSAIDVTVTELNGDVTAPTQAIFVQSVLSDAGAGNNCTDPETQPQTYILGDVNGDGTVNAADEVGLEGDDGTDSDGDGTARQTKFMYDIVGINKLRLCVMQDGDATDADATDDIYVEVSCR